MSRAELVQQVNDYLARLAEAGDQQAIGEILGPATTVDLSTLDIQELQWIYDEYVEEQ